MAGVLGAYRYGVAVKPYFEDDAVQIWHGDCREVMPTLGPVDLVLTDPPYNIGFSLYASYSDTLTDTEYVMLLAGLREFSRIAISQYPEEMMRYVVPALGPPVHVSAWCYNSMNPRRFRLVNYYGVTPDYARIAQPYKNPTDKRIQQRTANGSVGSPMYEWWADIDIVKNVSEEKTAHPCQLPERLIGRIITLTTDTAQTILDPFMGSGTTLRAAKDLGRKAIGIEIEERYCEIAAKRMAQAVLL